MASRNLTGTIPRRNLRNLHAVNGDSGRNVDSAVNGDSGRNVDSAVNRDFLARSSRYWHSDSSSCSSGFYIKVSTSNFWLAFILWVS